MISKEVYNLLDEPTVELSDPLDAKPVHKLAPNLRPQPIAEHQPNAMPSLPAPRVLLPGGLGQQIAADLPNVLGNGALKSGAICHWERADDRYSKQLRIFTANYISSSCALMNEPTTNLPRKRKPRTSVE
jgi:hypothetical protein